MTSPNTTRIERLARPLDGVAAVPGDKSISHRAVMFASMAERYLRDSQGFLILLMFARPLLQCPLWGLRLLLSVSSMVLLQVVLLAGGQMAQRSQRNLLIVVIQDTTARLVNGGFSPMEHQSRNYG